MPRFRTLAAGLIGVVCTGVFVQLCLWWGVELASSPGDATSGPHLQLVTDQLDLGRVAACDVVEARFVIANTGNETLIFRPAKRGQDRAAPLTSVAAGRTSEIVLPVEASEFPLRGPQRFRFLTNDAARPEFWLTVRATVKQPQPEEHSVLVRRPPD